MRIDGQTRLAAVVATPIKHSLSPFIHNRAFEETGINGVYVAWDIQSHDLEETVNNIRRYDMFGINISMPYKQAVLSYLDDIDEAAALIGAVNTVVNRDGRLIGYNTDGYGFFASLKDFNIRGKSMTILGGGGAATALIAQAALDGAGAIHVFSRQQSLPLVQERVKAYTRASGVPITVLPFEDNRLLQEKIGEADLLVNATSLGMDGQSSPLSPKIDLPTSLRVADLIYQPFETPFLAHARSKDLVVSNGLGMLLHQAAKAFELWTGRPMPTDMIWQDLIKKYRN